MISIQCYVNNVSREQTLFIIQCTAIQYTSSSVHNNRSQAEFFKIARGRGAGGGGEREREREKSW